MIFTLLVSVGGGKLEDLEKNLRSKEENQHQTQPTRCFPGLGIEPGPHWWEAIALANVPSPFRVPEIF